MKLLYVVWGLACAGVIAMTFEYNHQSTDFQGIAETGEIVINSEYPVEIRRIHAVPGQDVAPGDLLVELARPELTMRINAVTHQMEELKTRKKVDVSEVKAEILRLESEMKRKTSEFDSQINQLQAQYEMNKQLSAQLKSVRSSASTSSESGYQNPAQVRIGNLKAEKAAALDPLRVQIRMLEKELNSTDDPVKVQTQRLEKELNMLLKQKRDLYVFADISGVVGSVNVKNGEKAAPFTPILTLHARSPSYVGGYIHENVYHQVSTGREVEVVSMADGRKRVMGTVSAVGSRIVPFPGRLKKLPDVSIWGREVQITIPDNPFLLGEKVLIRSDPHDKGFIEQALAGLMDLTSIHAKEIDRPETRRITGSPAREIQTALYDTAIPEIEASGAVYLKDIKKYIVVSDDTKNNEPAVYLMGAGGTVDEKLMIEGLGDISDMEAAGVDEAGNLYVCCSQSRTKSGKLPRSRKRFVRIERDKTRLILSGECSLYDLLGKAARADSKSEWASFLINSGMNPDIEGASVYKGDLYLGLKTPLLDGRSVVLKIRNANDLFSSRPLDPEQVSIEYALSLKPAGEQEPTRLSDLMILDGALFLLSVAEKQMESGQLSGVFWKYDPDENRAVELKRFSGLKPEGLAFNSDSREFMVVFDQGEDEPSRFMTIQGVDTR